MDKEEFVEKWKAEAGDELKRCNLEWLLVLVKTLQEMSSYVVK